MDMTALIDLVGDGFAACLLGLGVGLMFGFFAQRSNFCLRAATIEVWRGGLGPKLAIWLIVFSVALIGTQILLLSEQLDKANVRQLAAAGSMSGAIVGGALFGVGMILSRGCASRLLVLSATGNMRALVTGLILTLCAQASLTGLLSPFREWIASLWIMPGGSREFLANWPVGTGLVIGVLLLAAAVFFAYRSRLGFWGWFGAGGVGAAVVGGWFATSSLAASSFEIVPVKSISFTGPSADTLMALINQPVPDWGFDTGMVPGVFLGSMIAALLFREFKIQTFQASTGMTRYLVGALLMGFGSMLAAGCAVGAGVTGGAVMAITAWVALLAMWISAGLTDLVLDRPLAMPESSQEAPSEIGAAAAMS